MSTIDCIGGKSGNLVYKRVRYVNKVKNHWFKESDNRLKLFYSAVKIFKVLVI